MFLFACLLHDIGHAPFSHTCEDLYNYQYKVSNIDAPINQELLKELKTNLENDVYDVFEEDYKYILSPKGKSPSEHEIMSAIVTCRKFKEYLAFFSECKNPSRTRRNKLSRLKCECPKPEEGTHQDHGRRTE